MTLCPSPGSFRAAWRGLTIAPKAAAWKSVSARAKTCGSVPGSGLGTRVPAAARPLPPRRGCAAACSAGRKGWELLASGRLKKPCLPRFPPARRGYGILAGPALVGRWFSRRTRADALLCHEFAATGRRRADPPAPAGHRLSVANDTVRLQVQRPRVETSGLHGTSGRCRFDGRISRSSRSPSDRPCRTDRPAPCLHFANHTGPDQQRYGARPRSANGWT